MNRISFVFLIGLFIFSQQQCPPNKPYAKIVNGFTICDVCPIAWNPYLPTPQCVESCPMSIPTVDPLTKWCTACPPEKHAWLKDSTGLYSCDYCPAVTPVFDRYRGECVSVCLPGYEIRDNACKPIARCPLGGKRFYDPIAEACVSQCPVLTEIETSEMECTPCPVTRPKWDGGICLEDCPRTKPNYITESNVCNSCAGDYWDNNALSCVSECPIPTPSKTSDLWCTTCSDATNSERIYWDPDSKACVKICPPSFPTWDDDYTCSKCPNESLYWRNDTQSCEVKCPDWAPSWDGNKWCEPCPVDKPSWNAIDKKCELCPVEKPEWDNITQTCVEKCYLSVPDTPDSDANKWCQACNNSHPYWNNTIHQCQESCPDIAPYINDSNWCLACTNPKPVWINSLSKCNETCPIDMPDTNDIGWCAPCDPTTPFYNSTSEKCEVCPGSTPFYDSDTHTCVNSCPLLKPDTDANKWCIPCGTNLYWDNFTNPRTCTSDCPNAAPLKNTSIYWCQACSGSTPHYNNISDQCLSACESPVGANNWCEPCPTETPYWDSTLSTPGCVAKCPASVPLANFLNVCIICLDNAPYWNIIDKVCVDTCPIPIPYPNPISKICQACPVGTKWNYLKSACVGTCPISIPNVNSSNWCEACPSSQHWNPITSSCTQTCIIPKPAVNSDNWCDVCPSAKPYWDAALPGCVSKCPRQTSSVDVKNQCQSCPSEKPNWDSDGAKCVVTCPPLKPFVGMDNWCEPCPNPTPYWFSGNDTCVEICPHVAPDVDNINWCQKCSGATLKWNPLVLACVSECPESLPFWNPISRTCEIGPDIGNIVEYLDNAGVVSTVVLAGMQISMPGIPYVALTILLINMLKHIRYIDIRYPQGSTKMFQRASLNIPSLNFGPLFPQDWKIATESHPAPERFAQYDISGLFIANFWRGLTAALIIAFGIGILKILLKKNVTNKTVTELRNTIKVFLIWNNPFAFFISNIGNIVLFIFIEYRSLYLHDIIGTLSFLLTLILSQISLVVVIFMIKFIKKTHKANKEAVKEKIDPKLNESFKILLEKYKHENLGQMLFIPIMCIRAALNAIIIGALDAPVIQCFLLVALNVIMLTYYLKTRPHRELVDNVQVVAFEITLLVADLVCLYLSTLPFEEQIKAESAGFAIIVCNAVMFAFSIIFTVTRLTIAAIKAFKQIFAPKRPSSTVSVQTDLTRAESDISTAHIKPKKTAKGKGFLTLSFESSAELNIGTEEDQSPTMNEAKKFNKNTLKTFHVVTIPDNNEEEEDEEQQHTSKYFDTEV